MTEIGTCFEKSALHVSVNPGASFSLVLTLMSLSSFNPKASLFVSSHLSPCFSVSLPFRNPILFLVPFNSAQWKHCPSSLFSFSPLLFLFPSSNPNLSWSLSQLCPKQAFRWTSDEREMKRQKDVWTERDLWVFWWAKESNWLQSSDSKAMW